MRAASASSLSTQLPKIKEALQWADYIAIDTEFTAFVDTHFGNAPTTKAVVEIMLNSKYQPQILQLGICPFKIIREDDKVHVKSIPMSFKTMPSTPTTFSFNSSNIEFLANNGFSLDDWVQDAFPYTPISSLEERLKEENIKTTAIQYIDNIDNTLYPGHQAYKDAGFSVIIKLIHELKKPIVLFVGIQDLFLIEREYVSGWDKVTAGTATTDPEEILGYLSPVILDVREICETPHLISLILKKTSRTSLLDMYMTLIKMQSDCFMADASMFNKNTERQKSLLNASSLNNNIFGNKVGDDSLTKISKPLHFVISPYYDDDYENEKGDDNQKGMNAHDAAYDAYMTGVCFSLLGFISPGYKVPLMANRLFLWKTCTNASTHSFSDSEQLKTLMKVLPFNTTVALENSLPSCVIIWDTSFSYFGSRKPGYQFASNIAKAIGKPPRECFLLSWLKNGVIIRLLLPIPGVTDSRKLLSYVDLSEFPPNAKAKVYTIPELVKLYGVSDSLNKDQTLQIKDQKQLSNSNITTQSKEDSELMSLSALEDTKKPRRSGYQERTKKSRPQQGQRPKTQKRKPSRKARHSSLGVVASGAVGVTLGLALLKLLSK